MLQDYVRTGTYQQAILQNPRDFHGKVVLDVGTGTGILAFFAAQCGARKVYAVDASDSCTIAEKLSKANGFDNIITIIKGRIEDIELPEQVDVIISEPIGFLLVHERMLETYITARSRFLKLNGLMYPSTGSIILAPFTDDALYNEQLTKISFWESQNFYGINLNPAVEQAYIQYFSQPVVGYINTTCLISSHRAIHKIDFNTITHNQLKRFTIDVKFLIERTAIMHGLAGWFDIKFIGTNETFTLSTSPDSPGTHWYQCKLLLREPIAVNKGQYITGSLDFIANDKFSYDIKMTLRILDTEVISENVVYLHDQVISSS
eukprot:gene20009-25983_t